MCICAQFMHIVYAHLFNCAWPITTARYWIIFRTVIICDTESIKATKVKKIAKKLIFALFCTIYAHYAYLINYAWTKTSITCWETFRTIIICNMELIRATEVEKKANVHMCTIYAHCARTRFFPDKRPCSFLSLIVLNIHAKFRQNPWSGSPGKVFTDQRTNRLTDRQLQAWPQLTLRTDNSKPNLYCRREL